MPMLEIDEIQGIILRGYGNLPEARFALLRIVDSARAKEWLSLLAAKIAFGIHQGSNPLCNIAFTFEGLRALGLKEQNLATFSPEFGEGMVTRHRQRILGDFDKSDPARWKWGGPNNDVFHILLAIYAVDKSELESVYAEHKMLMQGAGVRVIEELDSLTLAGRKEHFGFRDGIAQPYIEGDPGDKGNTGCLGAGEFILGYTNQYGLLPDSPEIRDPQGDLDLLNEGPAGAKGRDFGQNGSYLVFRQLTQDVKGFWNFLVSRTSKEDGLLDPHAAILLASKMVGRWPSGAPLVKFPEADPGGLSDDDNFGYRDTDSAGQSCPFGSHIRRTNPRDSLQDSSVKQSIKLSNHRRLIRRGRAFGEPLVPSMDPLEMMKAGPAVNEMGLNFICFNANIVNQFEFVQHSWANEPKFENFYNDPDPLIGVKDMSPVDAQQNFTIQDSPANRRVTDLERFVSVRGGAYFFMPGARALQYLSTLRENPMLVPASNDDSTGFLSAYDAITQNSLVPSETAKAQGQLVVKWLTERPAQLFGELRENRPVLVPPVGPIIITRFKDVVEAMDLFEVYTVKPAEDAVGVLGGGAKFLLGIDDTSQRERDQAILRLAVKRTDSDWIRTIVAAESKAIIDRAAGNLDLVQAYTSTVPLRLAGLYFGVPGPDIDTLRRWLRAMFRTVFRNQTHDPQVNQEGATQAATYRAYVSGLVAAAHAQETEGGSLPDSVLNRLVKMQHAEGASFSDSEITFNISSLLMGMIDTTNAAVNSAVNILLDRSEYLRGASAAANDGDDELLLRYILETLRFGPPVPLVARMSATDHWIGKSTDHPTLVPAGKLVYLAIGSAMMDALELENPMEFRLDRPGHQYLHLGWGMHRCFGKYIAQTLMVEMVKALLLTKNLRRAPGAAGHPILDGPFLSSFNVEYDV
jgi:Dyp-type peroxidase family